MTLKQKSVLMMMLLPFIYLVILTFFKPIFLFQGFDVVVAGIAMLEFVFFMLYTLKYYSQTWIHPLFAWLYTVVTFSVPFIMGLLVFRVRLFHSYHTPLIEDYASLDAYFNAVNHYTALKMHVSEGSVQLVFYLFASLTLLFALWLSLAEKRKRST